ncbi:MAG: radical SAM protein [Butyrivibrio sp.]|nr:radical SAM protein [Butyrivibrio sp.]
MRKVKTLQWMITERCNYSCRHCYLGEDKKIEPTTDELISYIPLIKEAGIESVVITGGEPLIRNDFEILVKELSRSGIYISAIITNGFYLNERILGCLKDNGHNPTFCISYDGDESHDFIRNRAGARADALKAFDLCKSEGFRTSSDMMFCRANMDELRSSVKTLNDHGCSSLKVTPLIMSGSAGKFIPDLKLSPSQVLDAFCNYIPDYYRDHISMEIYLNAYFYAASYEGIWAIPADDACSFVDNCEMGLCANEKLIPFLNAQGRLLPCAGAASAGKEIIDDMAFVKEVGFIEALNSPGISCFYGYTLKQQMDNNTDCKNCKYINKCMGGCRIVASFEDGSISGRDKYFCTYFRNDYREKILKAVKHGKELV